MSANPAEPAALSEPTDLDVAISVAQRMLAAYGTVDSSSIYAYTVAHGGLSESLRLLLRALDAEPGNQHVTQSSATLADLRESPRCPAAHPEDPTPCDGRPVVAILDTANASTEGCAHHGARLLASLDGARVYALPDAPAGTATRVFKTADATRPFAWLTDVPRTRDEQLSRAEVRARGERR